MGCFALKRGGPGPDLQSPGRFRCRVFHMPCIAARCFSAALGLLAFSGQAQQAPALPSPDQQRAFASCRVQLRGLTADSGVAGDAFDRFMAGIVPDMSVLPLLDTQPEFSTPIWDYLAPLVDDARIEDGKAMLAQYSDTFARVAQSRGVDAATVAAVWGVESDYGRVQGTRPLLVSLSTLSCFGRRQGFFRGELMATLALLQAGDLSTDGLTGSWAGAFGQTQFMPSTYRRIAVDGDGDGRRDLVHSVPDALASTANYLVRAGWQRGQPWGYEIKLPAGFDAALAGRTAKRPLRQWLARGITRADGAPLQATIETRDVTAWAVPRDAVLHDARGDYLFQLDHGKARRVDVTLRSPDGDPVGVLGPLDAKTPVIVQGVYELHDGDAVQESAR